VRTGDANRAIKAPDSIKHRYYTEDFPFGLLPFTELAKVAGVDVPVAHALLDISRAAIGPELLVGGRDAAAMGILDVSAAELLDSVTAGSS
jgi:opine dehydrogenase